MEFYNKLKGFLGIPPRHDDNNFNNPNNSLDVPVPRDHFDRRPMDDYEQFGFNVFSNPLEMHKYFEHQMNEMMKSFGIFNNDAPFFGNDENFFGGFNQHPSPFGHPQLPEERDLQEPPSDGTLRDNFLKPGYEEPTKKHIKQDSDLDQQYRSGDFGHSVAPRPQIPHQRFSFSRSVISKTITNSDGMMETHRTVCDESGNREEVVTHKRGDKEYTVVTRTDKNGVKEIQENLVNLDESEKDAFLNNGKAPKAILDRSDESMYDRFFRR